MVQYLYMKLNNDLVLMYNDIYDFNVIIILQHRKCATITTSTVYYIISRRGTTMIYTLQNNDFVQRLIIRRTVSKHSPSAMMMDFLRHFYSCDVYAYDALNCVHLGHYDAYLSDDSFLLYL